MSKTYILGPSRTEIRKKKCMSPAAIVSIQLFVEYYEDLPPLGLSDSQITQNKSAQRDVERLLPFLSSP